MACKGSKKGKGGGGGRRALIVLALALVLTGMTACNKAVWVAAGTTLGKCLTGCGVQFAGSLVTTANGFDKVSLAEVGWAAVPCVINCAIKAGGVLVSDPTGQSRSLHRAVSTDIEALCGRPEEGPPHCHIEYMEVR